MACSGLGFAFFSAWKASLNHEVLLAPYWECGSVPFSLHPSALQPLGHPPYPAQDLLDSFFLLRTGTSSSVLHEEVFFFPSPASEPGFRFGTSWVALLSWLAGWWMNWSGCTGLKLLRGRVALCKSSWWILVRWWWKITFGVLVIHFEFSKEQSCS